LLLTVEICWLVFVIFLRKKKSLIRSMFRLFPFPSIPFGKKQTDTNKRFTHMTILLCILIFTWSLNHLSKILNSALLPFRLHFVAAIEKKTKTKQKWLTRPFLIFKYFDFPANISPEYFHFVAYILYIYIVLLYYYYYYSLLLCWRWCCPVN
jgi:hypothetical protein